MPQVRVHTRKWPCSSWKIYEAGKKLDAHGTNVEDSTRRRPGVTVCGVFFLTNPVNSRQQSKAKAAASEEVFLRDRAKIVQPLVLARMLLTADFNRQGWRANCNSGVCTATSKERTP